MCPCQPLLRGTPTPLDKVQVNGTSVYAIRGTGYNLVQRDEAGEYHPVDAFSSDVSASDLEDRYGIWKDREVTQGMWFWKRTVREADGQVQPDEVKSFASFRETQTSMQSKDPKKAFGEMDLLTMESAEIRVQAAPHEPIVLLESTWSSEDGISQFPGWSSRLAPQP